MASEGIVAPAAAGSSGWLKTLAEMQDDVFRMLRDSERAFITPSDVASWLNEGYLELCARLRIPKTTATGTTTAGGAIALPTDIIDISSLYVGSTLAHWVGNTVFNSWKATGSIPGNTLFRVWDGNIETYPALASTSYTLEYISTPAMLAAPADKPVEIAPEMQRRIISYARAYAKWTEGEIEEGAAHMSLFERGLPDMPRQLYRESPGGISLIPSTYIEEARDA